MKELLNPDFLKVFIPLIGAVTAWYANEYRKQKNDEYSQKEARYIELLKSLRGFYVSSFKNESDSINLKKQFLEQLDLCWLYCPDNVIKKGYIFLESVKGVNEDSIKEKALGDFVVSIREDLLSHRFQKHTKLAAEDFKILYVK